MTAPAIHLAFDGGWSDGDPGDGRLRFDSPILARAAFLYINARDAQEVLLSQLVPLWKPGDVLMVERPSAERNKVVCWIIGPIAHGGSYYKVPVLVRTAIGGFATHDEVVLHHYASVPDTDQVEPAAWSPPPQSTRQAVVSAQHPDRILTDPPVETATAPVEALPVAPVAPVAAETVVDSVVQQIIREVTDPAIAARLDAVEQRLATTEDRLAGAERRIFETSPVLPAEHDEDHDLTLPSFLGGSRVPSAPPAAQPSPAVSIATADVLQRLDTAEMALSRMGADIADAITRVAALERAASEVPQDPPPQPVPSPSHRLVEAAHLARNNRQELPLRLMAMIGEAMGADWEAAALSIIRQHDAATEAEALAYADALKQANGG